MASLPGRAVVPDQKKRLAKKRVRLKDHTEKEQVYDIFADHWLVDSPRQIVKERTQVAIETPLSISLDLFYNDVASIPDRKRVAAVLATKNMMAYLLPRVQKLARGIGMQITHYLCGGSANDETQVVSAREIDILLVFEHHPCKVESLEGAYRIMALRAYHNHRGAMADQFRYGRSEDGTYLSSLVISRRLHELIARSLKLNTATEVEPFAVADGKAQIVVKVKNKYRVSILPATYVDTDEYYLVTRPYAYDDNPTSDMLWRMDFGEKETAILRTISMADRGVRVQAYRLLKALVKTESTLSGLTSYHVKSVLLHTFDGEVDRTPRWQRDSVHECFLVLLHELQHFLLMRNLPHFFVRGHNLLANMPERLLNSIRARVTYMVSNPKDIIRVLNKRNH